jgi:uncharacterized membrane protein
MNWLLISIFSIIFLRGMVNERLTNIEKFFYAGSTGLMVEGLIGWQLRRTPESMLVFCVAFIFNIGWMVRESVGSKKKST